MHIGTLLNGRVLNEADESALKKSFRTEKTQPVQNL